jgi:hypothetical protein
MSKFFAHAESFNKPKPKLAVKEYIVLIPQIHIITNQLTTGAQQPGQQDD